MQINTLLLPIVFPATGSRSPKHYLISRTNLSENVKCPVAMALSPNTHNITGQ